MGGFLSGFAAPTLLNLLGTAGTVAGSAGRTMQGLQNVQQQNQSNAAFGGALDELGPDYNWARQWFQQAGPQSAHDIAAAIGSPFGRAIQQTQQNRVLQGIFDDPNLSDEQKLEKYSLLSNKPEAYAGVLEAKIKNLGKAAPLSVDEQRNALLTDSTTPGLGTDYATFLRNTALYGNDASVGQAYKSAGAAIPGELKPKEVRTKDVAGIIDPNTGLSLKARDTIDPMTGLTTKREMVGLDLNPRQREQLDQAQEALAWIPSAREATVDLMNSMRQKNWNILQQRQYINTQWKSYMAGRDAAEKAGYDPRSLWNLSYPGVEPKAQRYFTLLGQVNQQMSSSMGIFRAVRLYQQISPHIPVPQDIPAINLERLDQAKARLGFAVQRVGEAEEKWGVFPFVGAGLGSGAPAAAPSAARPTAPGKRFTDADADAAIDALMR